MNFSMRMGAGFRTVTFGSHTYNVNEMSKMDWDNLRKSVCRRFTKDKPRSGPARRKK